MGECSRKLVVEVCNAKNLMPKDREGTASAYVVADFEGQRQRTKTRHKDLNPQWDERLAFSIHDPNSMASEPLQINVYNDKKTTLRTNFLGKVRIPANNFAKTGSGSLVYYPLEKRSVFSQIKGEIGLRLWFEDDEPEAPSPPPPPEPVTEEKKVDSSVPAPAEEKKEEPIPEEKTHNPPAVAPTEKPLKVGAAPIVTDSGIRLLADERKRSGYDLVDPMPFLFVRISRVRAANPSASVKITMGTETVRSNWDQVLAFDKECLNSPSLEISVWVGDGEDTLSVGCLSFDLQEVPKRVPPDSPLAPQWYSLENSPETEVMLAVWFGTQADESFQDAWHSDSGGLVPETRAKVYLSPKLWYLRLTVIQAQDLHLTGEKPRARELHVTAQLGSQTLTTSTASLLPASSAYPTWNEDLFFVAAEPFEPFMCVTVNEISRAQHVGYVKVHIPSVERVLDEAKEVKSAWLNLIGEKDGAYTGRINLRVCLEGGYHVQDEAAHVTSDLQPSGRVKLKPPVGVLEVGILGASDLIPVKTKETRGSTDCYVVVKYGSKWVRTRTLLDQLNPRWNEQYTWDVYDLSTVLTLGVFDNGRYRSSEGGKDLKMGKIRIRLSTLQANRVWVNSYSLVVLDENGARKMGELEIALRFSCSRWNNLVQSYASPILPRLHYTRPIPPPQKHILRRTTTRIVAARLGRSEPAMSQEVVQYMLDAEFNMWSMRRSRANWFRLVRVLVMAAEIAGWVDRVRKWENLSMTMFVHILFGALIIRPDFLLPGVFIFLFGFLALRFRTRQCGPGSIDPVLSQLGTVNCDDLDEEFDGFPTTREMGRVRVRYDRLRALAGRTQMVVGDLADHGERLEALFNWRDPRATGIFVAVCFVAALAFCLIPLKALVLGSGFYSLRHPIFRGELPAVPVNFFRRLPTLSDQIL